MCPRWEDIDNLAELVNSLVEGKAYLDMDSKAKREGEADWLGRRLAEYSIGKMHEVPGRRRWTRIWGLCQHQEWDEEPSW